MSIAHAHEHPHGYKKDDEEEDFVQRSVLSVQVQKQKQTTMTQAVNNEVEEIIKRISSYKGVIGLIIVNNDGIPIRTTLDNSTTVQYANQVTQMNQKARSCVRDLDPSNDLKFLRMRSKKHEIMVAPEKDYILIVVQNPSE